MDLISSSCLSLVTQQRAPSSVHTTVWRIESEEQMEFINVQLGISQWYDSYPPTHTHTQKCYLFVYLYFFPYSFIDSYALHIFASWKLSIKWLFFCSVLEVVLINSRYFASTVCWVQMTALWSLEGSCLCFDTACQLYAVSNTANWQFYSNSHSHTEATSQQFTSCVTLGCVNRLNHIKLQLMSSEINEVSPLSSRQFELMDLSL